MGWVHGFLAVKLAFIVIALIVGGIRAGIAKRNRTNSGPYQRPMVDYSRQPGQQFGQQPYGQQPQWDQPPQPYGQPQNPQHPQAPQGDPYAPTQAVQYPPQNDAK